MDAELKISSQWIRSNLLMHTISFFMRIWVESGKFLALLSYACKTLLLQSTIYLQMKTFSQKIQNIQSKNTVLRLFSIIFGSYYNLLFIQPASLVTAKSLEFNIFSKIAKLPFLLTAADGVIIASADAGDFIKYRRWEY